MSINAVDISLIEDIEISQQENMTFYEFLLKKY